MSQPTIVPFDRSRIQEGQRCQRFRWWKYHYRGRGIEAARQIPPPWYFWSGSAIHEGIEAILRGAPVLAAANAAVASYRAKVTPLLATVEDPEAQQRMAADAEEQFDLVLALVYGWGLVRLPTYLAAYEPIDIEREELLDHPYDDYLLRQMSRTDILSRRRSDGRLVIHNLKSVSRADKQWRDQFQYDQLTLMEYLAVDARVGEEVQGVVIEGLVKGSRKEWPEGSGQWRHTSPLIQGWVQEAAPPMTGREWFSRYAWTCDAPHPTGRGKSCPGGKEHRRQGTHKVSAREYPGGVTSWVDYLIGSDRALVEDQFLSLEPINRSDWDIARWKRMVLPNEVAAFEKAEEITRLVSIDADTAALLLDAYFPMETAGGNCLRPSQCEYFDICWGSKSPDDPEFYRPRSPNHDYEKQVFADTLADAKVE